MVEVVPVTMDFNRYNYLWQCRIEGFGNKIASRQTYKNRSIVFGPYAGTIRYAVYKPAKGRSPAVAANATPITDFWLSVSSSSILVIDTTSLAASARIE